MTQATTTASPWRQDSLDRTLALVNYGLLFASIFFAGIPGLVAVIIAYAQQNEAPLRIRSHLRFQIRIFWVAFGLSVAASAAALTAALLAAVDFVQVGVDKTWTSFSVDLARLLVMSDLQHLRVATPVVGLVVATIILSFLALLWLVAASAIGFIRLATDRAIGDGALRA
ncbi:hypothetical protein ACO2Q3_07130 [Caulobacter sp. KR2-114]|uniref:hypothetical protein n=1 Tax=Caulobacter sp. KR2-114 TaxID=3400912 RepID=UPI003C09D13F